jgi:hypothetical protein
MRAVASLPRSIIVIEVLEHAEQPRVFELGRAAGFVLHDPGGGFRKPLVFCDHSARNEVTVFGRFVGAQAEQRFATHVANNQQEIRRHSWVSDYNSVTVGRRSTGRARSCKKPRPLGSRGFAARAKGLHFGTAERRTTT